MELMERAEFLNLLHSKFDNVAETEGHSIFITGEAGIGKTTLVKAFCKKRKADCIIYQGTCDALFAPRPLAPLYDIAWQMRNDNWKMNGALTDRDALFASFFHELANQNKITVIVIDDIHWADEATLDFIKFLARRITQLHCLFILTYRDNEIHSHHPLRNVLGQLPPDSFTRLELTPLSRQTVEKMAMEKGYNGEDVYNVSGGNPFYVNEILASYHTGIPDNIRDSILSVYNRLTEKAKQIWQILSVFPGAFEVKYLEKLEPYYAAAIESCLESKILIIDEGKIFFKHELFRRTVESSLSPFLRVTLNKKILDLLLQSFEANNETERIIHHAKNANEYDLVIQYAPLAAAQAVSVGAHIEACRLYLTAIEYYQGEDQDTLLRFYEAYAYECYLTNQIKEAIIYTGKTLNLWKVKNNAGKTGNCLRFLSRLWWFDGNRKKAEAYADQAIEVLETEPSSSAKAMAYSNQSQLKMLSDQLDECLYWGEKAIVMANELADEETLSHALNNVGTLQMEKPSSRQKGIDSLHQSLEIALKNSYHDHAARAYINLGTNWVKLKEYALAKKYLEEGMQYCLERNLDSYVAYILSFKARLNLETGNWNEAYRIANNLIKDEDQACLVKIGALTVAGTIKLRMSDADALPLLLEAATIAYEIKELQRIIPVMVALFEYEWITGERVIDKTILDEVIRMVEQTDFICQNSEFAYWLLKARKQHISLPEVHAGYQCGNPALASKAARLWEKLGCPYQQALSLFEGSEEEKRKAVSIVHKLGANTVYEKMKQEMRAAGIKSIPRGIRRTTRSNSAFLTERELDVLQLLKEGIQNKEIATRLFISPKTVDHHISSILFKLDVNSRAKAVREAIQIGIIK